MRIDDTLVYHGERLYSGAIDLDWFLTNNEKSREVSKAYLFNGPQNLAINPKDMKNFSRKTIIDSISMTKALIDQLSTKGAQQFSLIIAGYGAGKSHYAITLAELLDPQSPDDRQSIIENITSVHSQLGNAINATLSETEQPVLVIPVNGMRNCQLFQEIFKNAFALINRDNQDTQPFNTFMVKYRSIYSFLENSKDDATVNKILQQCDLLSLEDLKSKMDAYNSEVYNKVYKEMLNKGIEYYEPAASGEVKDLLSMLSSEYCGEGKPYRCLLVLFDEFGKYMTYASLNPGLTGSGVLQSLFEGIVSSPLCHFIGISQLDLKEYANTNKRYGDSFQNEINRYVTRYDGAQKYYLSTAFESLLASLLEKKHTISVSNYGDKRLENVNFFHNLLVSAFPTSMRYSIWSNVEQYCNKIIIGCWPLDAFATWTLSMISSMNSVLQQRTVFNILSEAIAQLKDKDLPDDYLIYASDLLDAGLGVEFQNNEISDQTIQHAMTNYLRIMDKYGQQLHPEQIRLLKAMVIIEKLHPVISTQMLADALLCAFSGLSSNDVSVTLTSMEEGEFNLVRFNPQLHSYEIIPEGLSSTDFAHAFQNLYGKSTVTYDEIVNAFCERKDGEQYTYLKELNGTYALKHENSSYEWRYGVIYDPFSNLCNDLSTYAHCLKNVPHYLSEPRGNIIYTYVSAAYDLIDVKFDISTALKNACGNDAAVPLIVVILYDGESKLAEAVKKIVLLDSFSDADKEKFAGYIDKARKEYQSEAEQVLNDLIFARQFVCTVPSEGKTVRDCGDLLFSLLYPDLLPLKCDGFSDASGTVFSTLKTFVSTLTLDGVSWNSFQNLGSQFVNRARSLLMQSWKIFSDSGQLYENPENPILRKLFSEYDTMVTAGNVSFYDLYIKAQLPPYGANATSASILIFAYYAMRSSKYGWKRISTGFCKDSFYEYINQQDKAKRLYLMKTKCVSPDLLQDLCMYVRVDNSNAWKDLMDKYEHASTYSGVIECKKKADELGRKNIDLPTKFISQLSTLNTVATKAQGEIDNYCNVFSSYKDAYDALDHETGANLVRFLQNYGKLSQLNDTLHAPQSEGKWMPSDIHEIGKALQDADLTIEAVVPRWNEHNPINHTDKNDRYKEQESTYQKMIELLKSYGLSSSANLLASYYSTKLEQRKKVVALQRQALDFEKLFPTFVDNDVMVNGLNSFRVQQNIKQCKSILQSIEKNKTTCEELQYYPFKNTEKEAQMQLRRYQKIDDEKQETFKTLTLQKVPTIDQMSGMKQKIARLKFYFFGTNEQKTLEDLEKELNLLDQIKTSFNYATTPLLLDEEKERADEKINTMKDLQLDDHAIIALLVNNRKKQMSADSKMWVSKQKENLEKMETIQDALRIRNSIVNNTVVLAKQDQKEADSMMDKIDSFISGKKVEALLLQFNELSDSEKTKFLSELKNS